MNIQRWPFRVIEVSKGDGIGSKYEALSADARRAHGLAPTFWAYDELAQAKDRVLLDKLQTAMGKRNRSLGIVISTQAADDDHPLSQLIDDAESGADPSIVVHLLSAPTDADPFAPEIIRAVNPAFGKFLDEADVLAEAERARRMPSFESAFRNLRLNQRIAPLARDQLLTPDVWALGDAPIDEAIFADGRPVYGGIDLSARIDLTALVLAAEDDGGNVHLLPRAWTPADTLAARVPRDRAPYDAWVRHGQLDGGAGHGDRLRLDRLRAGRGRRADEHRAAQLRPLADRDVQAGAGAARHGDAARADGPGLQGHVAGGEGVRGTGGDRAHPARQSSAAALVLLQCGGDARCRGQLQAGQGEGLRPDRRCGGGGDGGRRDEGERRAAGGDGSADRVMLRGQKRRDTPVSTCPLYPQ